MFVSHADGRKSGSTTVEMLCHVFQQLTDMGVNLREKHVHSQADNCGAQNKNNIVFSCLGLAVMTGILSGCTVGCLRIRHTHEDIGQFSLWRQASFRKL